MKCVDCDLKKLQECKCGGNRYYCGHPDAPRQNGCPGRGKESMEQEGKR